MRSKNSLLSIFISYALPTFACSLVSVQGASSQDALKPLSDSAANGGNQSEEKLRVPRSPAAKVDSRPVATAMPKPVGTSVNPSLKSVGTTAHPSLKSVGASVNPSLKSTVSQSAKPATNASALERGKYFSRHGAYSDAFNFFTKAADADPKNPEPYNRRARVEWQLEKNDEALEDVRYAIKLNPDYAEAFCTRAQILNSQGKYHDAIVDTSLALELKPRLKEAYTIQASAYRNLKQYHEADELMQKLAAIPNPISAFDEWAPTIDYTQYIADLQSRVRQHFQPPQGIYPPIVVLFKMHRSGQVSDVRVNTAGVATADNAAVEAAKSAAPFNPPPAGSPPDFDVFVVLDPPMQPDSTAQIDAPAGAVAAAQAAQAPSAPPTPKAGINWGNTLNQGLNTGMTLMRFIRF